MSSTSNIAMAVAVLTYGAFALTTAAPDAQCTKSVPYEPEMAKMGSTGQCIFSSATTTTTTTVDCGSCNHVTMENLLGHGPECHGETTAPGTVTIQTAVCSGAAMPTSSTSTASINPGGPITPIPTPSQATSTSCSTFFTQTPGCNSAADNIRECMTTICGSGAPTTVQTSASEMGKCSTEYEVFGASVNTFVSCPPGVSQPTTATSTTERVGIPTCRFCG